MLLWEISNYETPPVKLLDSYFNTKLIVFLPLIHGNSDRIFVAALGSIVLNSNALQLKVFEISSMLLGDKSNPIDSLLVNLIIDSDKNTFDISVSPSGIIAAINSNTIFLCAFEVHGV